MAPTAEFSRHKAEKCRELIAKAVSPEFIALVLGASAMLSALFSE